MKIKSIVSLTLVLCTGLSFAYADESIVSIVKESKVEDVRMVGYELCQFFINKDKGYIHKTIDYLFGMEPEEALALTLKKNPKAADVIFSGKASEDPIIRELQEGCFDSLSEAILSLAHGLNDTFTSSKLTLKPIETLHCIDRSKNRIVEGTYSDNNRGFEVELDELLPCSAEEVHSHEALTEYVSIEVYYLKLIKLLGIKADRISALQQQIHAKFYIEHNEL